MVTWSITDNAKESLDADTYIEALELTDFKGIRGNLMVGKKMRLYQMADHVECHYDILNTCLNSWVLAIVVIDFVSHDNLSLLSIIELVILSLNSSKWSKANVEV